MNWVGFFAYVPLLIALEHLIASNLSLARKTALAFTFTSLLGFCAVFWGVTWPAASLHLFGHVPYWPARLLAAFAYGFEISLIFFIGFVLPLFFIKRTGGWDLGVRLFWVLLVDLYYPRVVGWSFGEVTLFQIPWLEQGADLVGAWGLGFFPLAANLLIAAWFRLQGVNWLARLTNRPFTPVKMPPAFRASLAIYTGLLAVFLIYGAIRSAGVDKTAGRFLQLVSVQPNFSFGHLSNHPDLQQGEDFDLDRLINQSQKGFTQLPGQNLPKLVVWPESAFSGSFFQSKTARKKIGDLAKKQNTHVLLNVSEFRNFTDQSEPQALSLWIDTRGGLAGVYEKITLMPFGEYIPLAHTFPAFGRFIRGAFPMIAEFQPGRDYKLFELGNGHQVAATICFDAANPEVFRQMAAKGADLIINQANLVWFGRSNAITHMLMLLRWRALENKVPVLLSALTGDTQLITATGKIKGVVLPTQTSDVWADNLHLSEHYSFYRQNASLVQTAAFFIFLLFLLLGYRYGRIFHR